MPSLSRELTVDRESTAPQARSFVRSLNVLFKYARLYGLEHSRSVAQFACAWDELQEAVRAAGQTGLLLGASGSQLLLDGVPLESTPAERSFADLLDISGVASICFSPSVEREELSSLVKAFMEVGPKARSLAERLEECFGKNRTSGIRVNEIRFVPEDASLSDVRLATQLAAKALGADADHIQEWFRSPQKMIQLIAAAEGARSGPGGGIGTAPGHGGAGSGISGGSPAVAPLEEVELRGLLCLLVQFSEAAHGEIGQSLDPAAWQLKLGSLPPNAQITLRKALARIAANTPSAKLDEATLLRLAEDLAISFALDRFKRGEVRVNAVRQLLDRMAGELETLRRILKSREEKLAGAGLSVESHADLLDRQFWAAVPDSGKRAVLTSPDAWCIPPRNIQQYIGELLGRGESEVAGNILARYALCVRSKDAEARKKAAIGLGQLAELYSKTASRRLEDALLQIGQQMNAEDDLELQTLLGAAFVRLSQEATSRRYYRAMQQSLDSLAALDDSRPRWAQSLRPRTGFENCLAEFIEEALAAEAIPEGMVGVLMRIPQTSAEQLALRLARSVCRTERENIIELAKAIGDACVQHLKEILNSGPPAQAVSVVGLLSRLDGFALEDLLPRRLAGGGRAFHDAVVRQLSIAGAPGRGQLLASSLEMFDTSVLPLALDEIGICGDLDTAPKLLRLIQGEILPQAADYMRVKAMEALGRMRATAAAGHLRRFVEARKTLSWLYPEEVRMAAAQALLKIDPEWIRRFLPHSGLDARAMDLAPLDPNPSRDVVRHRRYPRIHLPRAVPAVVTSTQGRYSSAISVLSLEGGLLHGDIQFPVGTQAVLKIPAGFRSIRMKAVVRFVRSQQAGFETISMALEDRAKLRRLLASLASSSS